MYTFCKSLCVINEGSPYGLHGDSIYILYLYDHMWLVGALLCVAHSLQSVLEMGQEARIVQIDFSAAFNRVNHQG